MKYTVTKITSLEMGRNNRAYISTPPSDKYISINSRLFAASQAQLPPAQIALNNAQREYLEVSLCSEVEILFTDKRSVPPISLLRIGLEAFSLGTHEVNRKTASDYLKNSYLGCPFNKNQSFYFYLDGVTFKAAVLELISSSDAPYGTVHEKTNIYITSKDPRLSLTGRDGDNMLLKNDFNFENLGIGGLKNEFSIMFRRAFVQRIFDPDTISKLGIPHVKGILLYGPPGTGKTLIARQIGSLLNARPPKIVNGPEILNKYVGQSEENIRNLFKDAEDDYKRLKEKSPLHVIIFDELDAIFKSRGSSSSNIGDQVVNQLLSKMDGVDSLDNVLIIGMTNRADLIDKALLRPGRFEIHIEISLPDEQSRFEIFKIHTKEMHRSGYLDEDVNLREMAKLSRNYTGAEICALVKSAASYALERNVHRNNNNTDKKMEGGLYNNKEYYKEGHKIKDNNQKDEYFKVKDGNDNKEQHNKDRYNINHNKEQDKIEEERLTGEGNINVTMSDFMSALEEVKPSFGMNEEDFQGYKKTYYELPTFVNASQQGRMFLAKLRQTNAYNTSSLLLYGPPGSGKTTLAVKTSLSSNFPFIKMISAKNMIGMGEYEKVNYIKDRFMDAYKSEESIIILDEIESLIDYTSIGPRFSNVVLQALRIFVKSE